MDLPNLKNATIHSVWTDLREFWKTPQAKQYRLEVFVLLTGLLLGSLLFLGSLRQRTSRSAVRICARAAFYLSGHALSYVMGVLNDSPVQNGLVVVWAVILLVLYGTADNAGSESLGDNEARRKRFLWDYMIPSIWFLGLLLFTVPPQRFWIPLLCLLLLFLLKLRERKLALMSACRSRVGLDRVTRVIAEYMKHDSLSNVEAANPSTMQGYKYLVGVKEAVETVELERPPRYNYTNFDSNRIVTVDQICQSDGWLLSSRRDHDGDLKDACVSFALFWLLLRRFADYNLDELSSDESRVKTWSFVRYGLINESGDGEEYERAFRVIEVELDFVYDYFYNNYYAVYSRGGTRYLLVRLAVVGLYFVVSSITLREFTPEEMKSRPWYDTNNVQIIVTKSVIYALIAIELAQICIIITSKWVKVKWVCNYVRRGWWWQGGRGKCAEWLLYILSHTPCLRPWSKPWQGKIHQYPLLESYGHTPKLLWFKWIFDGYMDLPTDGQKESKPVTLSREVKKAVIESLRRNGPSLSNGEASLFRNGEGNLSWAVRNYETSTHVILIWHVATSICEMARSQSPNLEDAPNFAKNFHVAASLSKYCAYLVALAPRLLPDHVHVTQCLFEQVVYEVREALRNSDSMQSKYDKLVSESDEADHNGSILKQGVLLGRHLMMIEDASLRWKVLAEFWAELILFLAPSNDAAVHAEYLVSGGEFITHLWALLTHAGIVSRDGRRD